MWTSEWVVVCICVSVYMSLYVRDSVNMGGYVWLCLSLCVSMYVTVYEYLNLYHRLDNHVRMGSWFARHSSSTMRKAMVEIVTVSVSASLCHCVCLCDWVCVSVWVSEILRMAESLWECEEFLNGCIWMLVFVSVFVSVSLCVCLCVGLCGFLRMYVWQNVFDNCVCVSGGSYRSCDLLKVAIIIMTTLKLKSRDNHYDDF